MIAALVVALAYTGLLLLLFLPFYLEFLQPYVPVRLLDTWSAVVLLAGVLAALVGLFPLLRERRDPLVPILMDALAVFGVALLLWGAVTDALYGPAYPLVGQVLVRGLFLSAVGLLPLGIWLLISGGLPRWAAAALFVGAPPLAILLFPLLGPAWVLVGYALFREGRVNRWPPSSDFRARVDLAGRADDAVSSPAFRRAGSMMEGVRAGDRRLPL